MEAKKEQPGSSRRNWILLGIFLLAILAAALYRWRSSAGFDWNSFAATFTGANWWWLSLSVPFILAAYAGRALRWAVMLKPFCPDPSIWRIFVATAIGFTAVVFFGRAGEMVRPYLIASKEKVTFSSQIAAWLLERILDLIMVLFIFGIALAQISNSGISPGPKLRIILQAGGTVIGVTSVACFGVLILFRYFTENMQRRLLDAISFLPEHIRGRIARFMAAFLQGMQSTRSNSYVVQLLAYSVLEWVLVVGCYVCLMKAFPVTSGFSLTDVVIFMGFVSFGAAIQIPGVGGGVQLASIFVLTEFFRLPLEQATGMALVLWLVTFVVIVPIGVGLAFHEGLKWKSLSHISEEVQP